MVLPRQSRQKHGRVACRKVQICPLDPDQLQTAAICRLKSGPSQRQPMKAKHRSTKYYTRCWVRGCSNTNRTLGDLSFHALPADEPIREYWIEQTKVAEPVSKSLRICSAHFGPSDFKMISASGRRLLWHYAYPSLRLPSDERSSCCPDGQFGAGQRADELLNVSNPKEAEMAIQKKEEVDEVEGTQEHWPKNEELVNSFIQPRGTSAHPILQGDNQIPESVKLLLTMPIILQREGMAEPRRRSNSNPNPNSAVLHLIPNPIIQQKEDCAEPRDSKGIRGPIGDSGESGPICVGPRKNGRKREPTDGQQKGDAPERDTLTQPGERRNVPRKWKSTILQESGAFHAVTEDWITRSENAFGNSARFQASTKEVYIDYAAIFAADKSSYFQE